MINNQQLRELIIQPVLKAIGLYSQEAEDLLVGTCAHESKGGTFLAQVKGPALGIYQMEPATHKDIWTKYLSNNTDLMRSILGICRLQYMPDAPTMIHNLYYATAMCRVHYRRVAEVIPKDLKGQAEYYKKYFNTPLGSATPQEYIDNYRTFMGNPKEK